MTSIETLMRDSNPMMDPSTDFSEEEIEAFDLLVKSRSGNMDIKELTKPVEPENRQRSGWLIAAAAFAGVIIFVGAAMLLARPADELPPATTPPTTEAAVVEDLEEGPATTVAAVNDAVSLWDQAIVDAFIRAFNASDKEAAMAAMSPSAKVTTHELEDSPTDVWASELAWRWALNEQWAVESCKASFGAVRCQLSITGGIANTLGGTDAILRVVISDGLFSSLDLKQDLRVVPPVATDIAVWLAAEYPEAVGLMFRAGNNPRLPILTEESIALWAELLPEYEASLDG